MKSASEIGRVNEPLRLIYMSVQFRIKAWQFTKKTKLCSKNWLNAKSDPKIGRVNESLAIVGHSKSKMRKPEIKLTKKNVVVVSNNGLNYNNNIFLRQFSFWFFAFLIRCRQKVHFHNFSFESKINWNMSSRNLNQLTFLKFDFVATKRGKKICG